MGAKQVYTPQLAEKLIRGAMLEMDKEYPATVVAWAREHRADLYNAMMKAFIATDGPCLSQDIQGLHAGLALFRSSVDDVVAEYRRQVVGAEYRGSGSSTAALPPRPLPKGDSPMVHMIPDEPGYEQMELLQPA